MTDQFDGRVTVEHIDPATNELTDTFDVGGEPSALAATDTTLWVADAEHGTLSRIDLDAATG